MIKFAQHKYTYRRHLKDPDVVSIFGAHQIDAAHECCPDVASIICVEPVDLKRKIKEALKIRSTPEAINKRETMFKISTKWSI